MIQWQGVPRSFLQASRARIWCERRSMQGQKSPTADNNPDIGRTSSKVDLKGLLEEAVVAEGQAAVAAAVELLVVVVAVAAAEETACQDR